MGTNWCDTCHGGKTIQEPGRRWWQFSRRVTCPGCGGDGYAKPPGWPDREAMERHKAPPPPPPPPKR